MKFKPHAYQQRAIDLIVNQPRVGLFLEMGLGKTVITLTAIDELLALGEVHKVLVVAPLRVAKTVWAEEAAKWDHLKGLRFSKMVGIEQTRKKAFKADADIYVINRENLEWLNHWLMTEKLKWPFDMLVLDELSSFKNRTSERWKAARRREPHTPRIVGLTGTPTPNGLLDLWAQIYLLDGGEALGKTLNGYRERYFYPAGMLGNYNVIRWEPRQGSEERILKSIEGLCLSMRTEDYLELPPVVEQRVSVPIGDKCMKIYNAMRAEMLVELGDQTITAANAAALTGKLLQLTGGAMYDEQGNPVNVHGAKLDALRDVVDEAQGAPVLCFYWFKHELIRLRQRFPDARELLGEREVEQWNAGKIPLLLAHPAAAGHGLNLQQGGHIIVWYTLPWSLELYQQANARLHRQGQTEPVSLVHLIAPGTVDEHVMKVLAGKASVQDGVMDALRGRGA